MEEEEPQLRSTGFPMSEGSIIAEMENNVDEGQMDPGYKEIIAEMENNVDKGQSGSGSIVSVTGQINGVLAGYPNDVTVTRTEMIQDGVDGDIWPLVGDETGQQPEPPPNQSYAERQGECDNENYHKTKIVGMSQTGVDNTLRMFVRQQLSQVGQT